MQTERMTIGSNGSKRLCATRMMIGASEIGDHRERQRHVGVLAPPGGGEARTRRPMASDEQRRDRGRPELRIWRRKAVQSSARP